MDITEHKATERAWISPAWRDHLVAIGAGRQDGATLYVGGAPTDQTRGAVDLLATFVDDDPCSLDHHGYCQTHNWFHEDECNVARARRLVGGQ